MKQLKKIAHLVLLTKVLHVTTLTVNMRIKRLVAQAQVVSPAKVQM
ncbi:MAG: hypothetical protein HRU34_12935 [Richelia sp.]|nr:hypothetical protein [Richelia sp.]CDN12643.1 hypothetical protein RintRC_5282 [Richelia intracellularis]